MSLYRAVLALPGVAPLLVAATLARLAGRMFLVVLVLYALARFGDAEVAGWAGFAALIPGLVASPLAGALLDRLGAGRMIIADLVISALWLAVLAAAEAKGAMTAPLLLALAALYGVTTPLSTAGVRAILPRLVPEAARDAVNALDTTVNAAVDLAGPLIAGPALGLLGAPAAFGLIALLYAVAALAGLRVLSRDVPAGVAVSAGLFAQALAGVRLVAAHRVLRGVALSYGLQMVSWGMMLVIVPVAVAAAIGAGPAAESLTGGLWAVAGAAGIVGALSAGRFGIIGREGAVIALGGLATAIALFPLAGFGLPGLLAGMLLMNFAAGPVDVAVLTLRQRRTEPAMLGRVIAVSMSFNMCGLPIGSALGGMLAAHSLPLALAGAALASLASAMLARALLRSELGHRCLS